MARIPVGIQLGKGARPGLVRALEILALGLLAISLWGGVSLWKAYADREALETSGAPGSSLAEGSDSSPVLEPGSAREAAVLLFAGVLDTPRVSAALDTVRGAAPPGIQIAGIEVRPGSGQGGLDAVIAAGADSPAAVARFLAELADHESVHSTHVISETRQPDGATLVRITAQLTAERP